MSQNAKWTAFPVPKSRLTKPLIHWHRLRAGARWCKSWGWAILILLAVGCSTVASSGDATAPLSSPPSSPPAQAPLPTPTLRPPPRAITVGVRARVNLSDGLWLHLLNQPTLSKSIIITQLLPGAEVNVLDGPRAAQDRDWWKVASSQGQTGWTLAAFDNAAYLLPVGWVDQLDPLFTATPSVTGSTTAPDATRPALTPIPPGTSRELGRVCDDVGCNGDRQTRKDGMVMVYVPGGTFPMGSAARYGDEQPVHPVTLDGFWIDRTEVTNAQYQQCVKDWDCDKPGNWCKEGLDGPDQPVVCVSWENAGQYCAWAGARLPTEAEWAYAARGPEGFIYSWGDAFSCAKGNFDDELEMVSGEGCDGYAKTAPVGSFPGGVSWCGALDLSGNVWEWVQDWYGPYPDAPRTNPTGPETGTYRVSRGGSWLSGVDAARAAYRASRRGDTVDRDGITGFRCVRDVGEGP